MERCRHCFRRGNEQYNAAFQEIFPEMPRFFDETVNYINFHAEKTGFHAERLAK